MLPLQHGVSMTSSQLPTPGPGPAWTLQPPPTPGRPLTPRLRSVPPPPLILSLCRQPRSLTPSPNSSLPSLHFCRSSSLSCPFGFKKGWWALVSVLTGDLTEEGSFELGFEGWGGVHQLTEGQVRCTLSGHRGVRYLRRRGIGRTHVRTWGRGT